MHGTAPCAVPCRACRIEQRGPQLSTVSPALPGPAGLRREQQLRDGKWGVRDSLPDSAANPRAGRNATGVAPCSCTNAAAGCVPLSLSDRASPPAGPRAAVANDAPSHPLHTARVLPSTAVVPAAVTGCCLPTAGQPPGPVSTTAAKPLNASTPAGPTPAPR